MSHHRCRFDRLDPSYKLTRCCWTRPPQKARTGRLRAESALRSGWWTWQCAQAPPALRLLSTQIPWIAYLLYWWKGSFCLNIKYFSVPASLFTFHFSPSLLSWEVLWYASKLPIVKMDCRLCGINFYISVECRGRALVSGTQTGFRLLFFCTVPWGTLPLLLAPQTLLWPFQKPRSPTQRVVLVRIKCVWFLSLFKADGTCVFGQISPRYY